MQTSAVPGEENTLVMPGNSSEEEEITGAVETTTEAVIAG